jgi:hypothetical protein
VTGGKAWFGPKRVGFGIRPQTWQGWLVMAIITAAIILLAVLLSH